MSVGQMCILGIDVAKDERRFSGAGRPVVVDVAENQKFGHIFCGGTDVIAKAV